MSHCTQGVDVILEDPNSERVPHCAHGPCLLFERFTQSGLRRFYACSACRDRRECGAFQYADQWLSNKTRAARSSVVKQQQRAPLSAKQCRVRLSTLRRLPEQKRVFCQDCGLLVLPNEGDSHRSHRLVSGLKKGQLRRPTSLLTPRDNNKTNAQYFFSEETVEFLADTLQAQGANKVLCVGAPRIHEEILARQRQGAPISSLLLDIDHRLMQFYRQHQFCRYNMFNHYLFPPPAARGVYEDYLNLGVREKMIVIMDPPFGGLVEVLAHTVGRIQQDYSRLNPQMSQELGFLWIFPYFQEPRIKRALPDFNMLDYKVLYDNHKEYSREKKKPGKNLGHKQDSLGEKGSPVRVFTNLPPHEIVLPEDEYKLCVLCRKYTWKSNSHCDQCKACTSKDGQPYNHCSICERCVKQTWAHCTQCNTCHLPRYSCTQKTTGCHICGSSSHKRKECPKRRVDQQNHKPGNTRRKETETSDLQRPGNVKKRKKTKLKQSSSKRRKKTS